MIQINILSSEMEFAWYHARGVGARRFLVGGGQGGIKRAIRSGGDTLDARLTIQPHQVTSCINGCYEMLRRCAYGHCHRVITLDCLHRTVEIFTGAGVQYST